LSTYVQHCSSRFPVQISHKQLATELLEHIVFNVSYLRPKQQEATPVRDQAIVLSNYLFSIGANPNASIYGEVTIWLFLVNSMQVRIRSLAISQRDPSKTEELEEIKALAALAESFIRNGASLGTKLKSFNPPMTISLMFQSIRDTLAIPVQYVDPDNAEAAKRATEAMVVVVDSVVKLVEAKTVFGRLRKSLQILGRS
jgi:hypothetical protein